MIVWGVPPAPNSLGAGVAPSVIARKFRGYSCLSLTLVFVWMNVLHIMVYAFFVSTHQ
jgi:hypothetical protein